MTDALPPVARASDVAVYLDPPTTHHQRDRLFDRESNPYAGDDILAPYVALYDRLNALGIEVHTSDALPDIRDPRRKLVISYGMPDAMPSDTMRRYRELARRRDVVLSAFFALECPIVEPGMYRALPRIAQLFQRVMSWSDTESLRQFTGAPVHVDHFCWPQSFDAIHEDLWGTRDRKFLLMMNTNKLPRLYVDELYTARLRAVQYFAQFGEIDLYGRYWDEAPRRVGKTRTPATLRRLASEAWRIKQRIRPDPLYVAAAAATRGATASKSRTFAQYRFALCFENSVLKGWMTEKLFDSFFAGTIPVYWGAPDVYDWVPAECFIDMTHFKDFAELRRFLHAITPAQEERYRDAARAYLASDRFDPFRLRSWVTLHTGIISADTGLDLSDETPL